MFADRVENTQSALIRGILHGRSRFSLSLSYKSVIPYRWAMTGNVVLDTFIYLLGFVYTWHLHSRFYFHLTTYITQRHIFITKTHFHHRMMELCWEQTACSCFQVSEIMTFSFYFFFSMMYTRLGNLPWNIGSVAFFTKLSLRRNVFGKNHRRKTPVKQKVYSKFVSEVEISVYDAGFHPRQILYFTMLVLNLNIHQRQQFQPVAKWNHLLFVTIH